MLQSCSSATAIQPDAQYSWNCQGEALSVLGKLQEALTAFEQAIALDAQEPIFWLNKAESLLALDQVSTGIRGEQRYGIALLEQVQSDESSGRVKSRFVKLLGTYKGQALLQQQEDNRALAAFKQALNYNPDHLSAQWGKAIALQKSGNYSAAKTELELILNEQIYLALKRQLPGFIKA